ncbi:hypothetical protein D3C84_1018600 [compost metagenome]
MHQQGPGAAGAAAGVQLDAEQAEGVDADAHRPLGETRVEAQHEALAPFFGLVLADALVILAEVAIHVEVARVEGQLAVLDEVGVGDHWQ